MGADRVGGRSLPIGGWLKDTLESLRLGAVVIVRVGVVPALCEREQVDIGLVVTNKKSYLDRLRVNRPEPQCMVLRPGDQLELVVVCLSR